VRKAYARTVTPEPGEVNAARLFGPETSDDFVDLGARGRI